MKHRFFGPTGKDNIGTFVNDGSSIEINDIGDLVGHRIVTTNNESWGYLIDYLIDNGMLDVVKVDTPQEAFDLVKEGKADCFLYSIPAGEGVIATYGLSGFKHSAVIETMNFYAAILADSPYADVMAQAFENSSLPEFKGNPILA
jgi:ABC-type amino acid transport substrate-binding protein